MGGNVSVLPPTPSDFPYFSITMRIYDKLKLINADKQVTEMVRNNIMQYWPDGIQEEEIDSQGIMSFKCNGYPFSRTSSKGTAVHVRRLCCALLGGLRQMGWELLASCDLSRTQDLTTWFFHRNPAVICQSVLPHPVICVSISSYDKLALINSDSSMFQVIKDCVGPELIQDEERFSDTEFRVKMHGYLWNNMSFEQGITARRLLLNIFRRFDSYRYRFLGTANCKGTADAMFFQKDDNYLAGETQYGCLSLNKNDRIRLIDLPENVHSLVEQCIGQYWHRGLQEVIPHPEIHVQEYKLSGYPWLSSGEDAIHSRLLITVILQTLLANGWAVHATLDVSRRPNDKGIFILRSCTPASMAHFCLAPTESDKIRIINAAPDVVALVDQIIREQWIAGEGIQECSETFAGREWKLSGYPWHPYGGNDWALARVMIAMILWRLSALGWRLVCSSDVSSKYHRNNNKNKNNEYPLDVHALFFVQTGVATNQAATAPPPIDTWSATASSEFPDAPPPAYSDVMGK